MTTTISNRNANLCRKTWRPLPVPLRGVTWMVITAQLILPISLQTLVAAEPLSVQAPDTVTAFQTPPPAPEVTVNRTVPQVEPPSPQLKFSDNPTDEEISRARVFSEPIVSIGRTTSPTENSDLAQALLAYHNRVDLDDASPIESFLQAHPDSPRYLSLLANLASHYHATCQFSKALATWQQVWTLGKDNPDPQLARVVDQSVSEWTSFLVTLGRKGELEALLQELKGRNLHGPAASAIADAGRALWQMQQFPERTFKCGPFSLARIRAALGAPDPFNHDIDDELSTTNGTTLYQNWLLAQKMGLKYQMAVRQPAADIPLPAMVHWKEGHFSALTKFENGRYLVEDPTFAQGWVSPKVLDEESDGYFLIPEGPLPSGWSPTTKTDAQTVWGRSWPSQSNTNDVTPYDQKNCNPPCCPMAQYAVHLMRVSLNISDTPVGYQPPIGPAVKFQVTYNERDPIQPAIFNYSNLGDEWSFDWLSYVQDDSTQTNANVTLKVRGGGGETFINLGNGTFLIQPQSQLQLVRTAPSGYKLIYPDGSMDIFTNADATGPRHVFMTQTLDPAGNTNSFTYDSNFRLIAVKDAIGQVTTVSYELTNDIYKITKVTDPFTNNGTARSAIFQYNSSGQLTNITDILGITSAFTYGTATNNGPAEADFINSLTTPYGTTTFSNNYSADFSTRWIVITDPLGGQERVEFSTPGVGQGNYLIDSADMIPSGINTNDLNVFVDYRATYYWDKKAMQDMQGNIDYSKARQYVWLVSSNNVETATGALESEKKPLEARVYFNYPNQQTARIQGTIDRPTYRASVYIPGTTKLSQFQYNPIGKVTTTADPAGRATTFVYATNNIDLLTVAQTSFGISNVLGQFTYNSQHLPLTAKDAAGQTTSFGYNSKGQLIAMTNALNETVFLNYSTNGYLTNIVAGVLVSAGHNSFTNNPLSTSSFTYDNYGRVRTVSDPLGYTITASYDAADRPTNITYMDGTYERIVYNYLDPVLQRDRDGHWTSMAYDPLRHLTDTYDNLGRRTHFDWCNCGSLTGITDPLGHVTQFIRDLQSRVTTKIYPDSTQLQYAYETNSGRLLSVTDARNQTTSYSYFIDNDLQQVTYSDGVTPGVSFTYDAFYNRMTTMTDGTGVTTYNYYPVGSGQFGAGQLSSVSNSFISATSLISYNFDALGRITNRAISGVAQQVVFDHLGRVVTLTNVLGTFSNAYLGATALITTNFAPFGKKTIFSYYSITNDERLKEILNQKTNGVTLSKFDYVYDAVGNITNWTEQADAGTPTVQVLQYDPVNQLLNSMVHSNTVAGAILRQYAYAYDLSGNRTSEQIGATIPQGGTPVAVSQSAYNNVNQVTSRSTSSGPVMFAGYLDKQGSNVTINGSAAGINHLTTNFVGFATLNVGSNTVPIIATDYGSHSRTNNYGVIVTNNGVAQTISYDANGNMTNVVTATSTNSYQWDAANRLTSITGPTNQSLFTYDGLGRRVQIIETTNGVAYATNKFIWDGVALLEQRDLTGGTVVKRFFGQGEQISGANYYFTRDHLGSIREMLDATGAIKARYDYDPYGRQTKISSTVDADFGYAGMYVHQPSGLYLTLYRAYSADLARWLSRDLLAERAGLNLYDYVANNPINRIDPDGRIAPLLIGAAVALVAWIAYNAYNANNSANNALAAGNARRNMEVNGDYNGGQNMFSANLSTVVSAGESLDNAAEGILEFPTEAGEYPGAITSMILNSWPESIPNTPDWQHDDGYWIETTFYIWVPCNGSGLTITRTSESPGPGWRLDEIEERWVHRPGV